VNALVDAVFEQLLHARHFLLRILNHKLADVLPSEVEVGDELVGLVKRPVEVFVLNAVLTECGLGALCEK